MKTRERDWNEEEEDETLLFISKISRALLQLFGQLASCLWLFEVSSVKEPVIELTFSVKSNSTF